MAVKIITGAVGSGKTQYCIDEIRKIQSPVRRCVMIVPSHYSHETEKLIVDTFGGTGLNNIEVTSFEKLARELLKGTERRLAASGKNAVICRAVKLALDELRESSERFDGRLLSAVGKSGFIDVAASLISELHRYMVTGDMLRDRAQELSDGALKQKLLITALIAENYDRLLSDSDYIDSDEDLLRLSGVVGARLKNAHVWLDRFDELLPQQLAVLQAIIDSGAEVTITFNTAGDDTYYGTISAIEQICDYCNAEVIRLPGSMRHIKNAPDLKFLFSTWHNRAKYTDKVRNAEVFEARDAYTEIEHTASRILDLVREDKYRFRDITVICGNIDSYSHIIEAVFDEYDIPYYSDESFAISAHPIAMQILSLFDIMENNWDYSSMFDYLRAGFVYIKQDLKFRRIPSGDIDRLENYVIKHGIRGKSMWNRNWISDKTLIDRAFSGDASEELGEAAELDSLRRIITEPIAAYCAAAAKAETVTDYCMALYEFLESINLYYGLKAELLGMAMNRATAEAQRFGQIWNLLLDVLDQVNTALGGSSATEEEFAEYMRAAMSQCKIRTIPSGVDRVFIGTVEKNRSVNTKVLFAIGAVSGTFPSEGGAEGFLSNADRDTLAELDIKLAPKTTKKTEKQYNSVYKTFSAATERLILSYPVQTPDGQACRRSQTVIDICSKLPGIEEYNDVIISPEREKQMYISSPAATLHKLLIHPTNNPLWQHVNEWYRERDEWRMKLSSIEYTARSFGEREIDLDESIAGRLYNGIIYYSPTHLNSYAQCPFQNFIKYGLGAHARDEYALGANDTGSYAHELINQFCNEVDKSYKWSEITDEQCESIVDGLVRTTIKNISDTDMTDKERICSIFARMGATVKNAAKTVRKSICSGSFIPCAYEKRVTVRLTDNISVSGIIDRLDVCEHDGIKEYRVIDYKTGSKNFSVAEICEGIDMQPVIYALATYEQEKDAVISGMYYGKVRNDYAQLGIRPQKGTLQKRLNENTELVGATFVETDKNGDIIPESANRIESELSRLNDSIFFNKDTAIGKNIRSRAAGGRLMDEVRNKIIDMDNNIRRGDIEISPLGRVCDYCDYSAVCKFDEDKLTARDVSQKDNEVWERLEKDGDE